MQAFIGSKSEHQLTNRRIRGHFLSVRKRIYKARSRHHFKALIDADKKFRRNDRGLNSAKLRSLDLPRNHPSWLAG